MLVGSPFLNRSPISTPLTVATALILESASYLSSEYFELERIYEQEEKVKEKLNLPENCTIRYEKVKCSKKCKYNTHQYYYAYIWDCNSKKLRKKYIGKQLPLPTTANIV